jgi:predicted MFS family arabinose efflux permease
MTSLVDRVSPYRDALSFSSFRKLLIGQGLSMAGDAVCLAALPVAMIHAGFSGEIFGFVMAAVGVGTLIGAVAGGMLADRRSPKHVLVATDIARGVAQVVVAALIASGGPLEFSTRLSGFWRWHWRLPPMYPSSARKSAT